MGLSPIDSSGYLLNYAGGLRGTSSTGLVAKAGERLRELPSVLPSLAMELRQPRDLVDANGGKLASCAFQAPQDQGAGLLQLGALSMCELRLICVKTTPLRLQNHTNGRLNVGLSYAGDLVYEADGQCSTAAAGDVLILGQRPARWAPA